ncbi:MAG: TetR/AcrR family transcriptional regulator [Gammaproteobacteria bacterium]
MDPIAARRLEEKERRRSDLLDAAERVAEAAGLEGLTMDLVAREARVSRGLVYVYFKDRQDLAAGICERALRGLHARFAALEADHPRGLDRVVALGRAYVAFAAECPLQFEILARFEATGASANDGSNHSACLVAGADVHAVIVAALEAGMADGSVSPAAGSPGTVALSLWAMTHGTIQVASMKRAVLAQHGVTPDRLVEQTLRMATIALLRGG